jgi:hypothetical protein
VAKGGRLRVRRLSAKAVCEIVKADAGRIGLKPGEFGAHSLRAGFVTSAARRGATVFKMRDVSRHKSMDVLQAYVRDADLFRDHAGIGCEKVWPPIRFHVRVDHHIRPEHGHRHVMGGQRSVLRACGNGLIPRFDGISRGRIRLAAGLKCPWLAG